MPPENMRISDPVIDPVVKAVIERQERVKACAAEVARVLNYFGCVLDAKVIISKAGTRMMVDIVPKPEPTIQPPKDPM